MSFGTEGAEGIGAGGSLVGAKAVAAAGSAGGATANGRSDVGASDEGDGVRGIRASVEVVASSEEADAVVGCPGSCAFAFGTCSENWSARRSILAALSLPFARDNDPNHDDFRGVGVGIVLSAVGKGTSEGISSALLGVTIISDEDFVGAVSSFAMGGRFTAAADMFDVKA